MAISYADIQASALKAVSDATASGQPLNGENVLFPGAEWDTDAMDTWAIPGISEDAYLPDRLAAAGHNQTFSVLIYARLSPQDAYAREKLAEKFRSALEGQIVDIKNYISSDGLTTIGKFDFREAVFSRSLLHDEGVYAATLRFDSKVYEA